MSDYRVVIRVKNNLLYTLMRERGIKTQSELARAVGLHPTEIGRVANLLIGAFTAYGQPSAITKKLCDYFRCLPEDIYPKEVLHVGLPGNVVERVVSSEEVARYMLQHEADPALQLENTVDPEFVRGELDRLPPKTRRVIEARFFEDLTLEEAARELGVTKERARQLEMRGLESLRTVLFYDMGGKDASTGGLASRWAQAAARREALDKKRAEIKKEQQA